jgi:WD40 repeat protein
MIAFGLALALLAGADPVPPARFDAYGDPLPDGVIARLGTERFRRDPRSVVAILADGQTLREVAPGIGLTIRDYDLRDCRLKRQLLVATAERLRVASISQDGGIVAAERGYNAIELWDVSTGNPLRTLTTADRFDQYSVQLSADGCWVIAVLQQGQSKQAHLWKVETGEGWPVGAASNFLYRPIFSPEAKSVLIADERILRCWDAATRTETWSLGDRYYPTGVFSLNGKHVLVVCQPLGGAPATLHRIDMQTGKKFEGDRLPDDTYAFHKWGFDARKVEAKYPGLYQKLALGPDEKWFVGGYRGHVGSCVLQKWDTETGKELWPDGRKMGHSDAPGFVGFSSDGRRLASTSANGPSQRTLIIWDVEKRQIIKSFGELKGPLAFAPDGRSFFVAESNVVTQRNADDGEKMRAFDAPPPKEPTRLLPWNLTLRGARIIGSYVSFNPNAGMEPDQFIWWDLTSGQLLSQRPCSNGDRSGLMLPDGERCVSTDGKVIDLVRGKQRAAFVPPSGTVATGIAMSNDGRIAATQLWDRYASRKPGHSERPAIVVWETATGRPLRRLDIPGIGAFALSPDGRRLAGSDAAGLGIWDILSGKQILKRPAQRPQRSEYYGAFACSMLFAPDGQTLSTGHPDTTILLWDTPAPKPTVAVLDAETLDRTWAELASREAKIAYAAAWRLADSPGSAIPFLKRHVPSDALASPEKLKRLIGDLDNIQYVVREAATAELAELGEQAERAIQDALKGEPSPEARRRLNAVLPRLPGAPSPEELRVQRALHALEQMRASEATALLTEWSEGDPLTLRARLAKQALVRVHGGEN